jgi:hypothetical protein
VRTEAGRVEIRFPDGTGIEVAEFSAVELLTETRVRLLAGSIDRLEPLQASGNALGAMSAPYLPQDLKMYGSTFDQYGTWRYAPDYGYVWYPMVAADWRPYYYGYWEPVRRYGWTWIGSDVWAWPTHHYGRWGYRSGAWFWVPDRTFAAAWVSWGSAPGYVSWCPLGFDNRPVFAASIGGGTHWSGWTVVSRTHFGSRGLYANRYAVDPRRLPQHTTFVTQTAPAVAIPRDGRGHVTNGVAAGASVPVGAGAAVPRGDRTYRAGAFENRPTPATARPPAVPRSAPPAQAAQPAPVAIPPVSARPERAGTWRSPSEQRREHHEPAPAATGARPQVHDPRPQRAAQPAPASQPQPQPPPPSAQPRSAPSGSGSHDRAGTTAQPRGGNHNGSNTNKGESRATARRRG